MSAHASEKQYYVIFGVLLAALGVSLALSAFVGNSAPVIAAIFAIAVVKAGLVLSRFMHLSIEPRFLKVVLGGAASMLAILFVGVYPDVTLAEYGKMAPRATVVRKDADVVGPADVDRGGKVYAKYCVPCHQADGKGMNGKIAADFVDDETRLAKTDEELLGSITNGKKGSIGQMPAWGPTLSMQQRVDVLAYVRATFGKHP